MKRVIGFTGALALLTLWIMIEGYRIITGQNRTALIGFVMRAGKMVAIISIATSSALYKEWVQDTHE